MRRSLRLAGLGIALVMGSVFPAAAQSGQRRVEINAHAGGLRWDDKIHDLDPQLLVGGRLVVNLTGGWGLGGNLDWSKTTVGTDVDYTSILYSGEIDYTFPSASRARFFVGAGVGGARRKIEDPGVEETTGTFLLVPVAAGLKWFNRAESPSWAIRADIRDNIIFADDESTEEEDEDPRNNFELSAGLSILLGGAR